MYCLCLCRLCQMTFNQMIAVAASPEKWFFFCFGKSLLINLLNYCLERTGGASERASDNRWATKADDAAVPQEAGGAQGEETKPSTWQTNSDLSVSTLYYSFNPGPMFQKLEDADDDSYLDSQWSDRQALKRQFQGLTNIKWGPR